MNKPRIPERPGAPPQQLPPEEMDVVPGQPVRYRAAGHELRIPPEAIPDGEKLRIRFSVRNPQRAEVDIDVIGRRDYQFRAPVTLRMSYAGFDVDSGEKYHIFLLGRDRQPVEDLGGFDDKDASTVTAYIQHLSGYAIAGGRSGGG